MKYRFAIVGAIATIIDFGLLFSISALGLPSIAANFISSTVGFCFSFFANRNYTFKATDGHAGKQIFLYIGITLFGIWVLQPPVIYFGEHFIKNTFHHLPWWIILGLSKFTATAVTLVWNYYSYSRVVFNKPSTDSHTKDQ